MISTRPSPNEVQPLMIYPQQAHTAFSRCEVGETPGQANLLQEEDSVLPPSSPHDQQI